MKKAKKITLLSTIIIIVGSVIGAGIFFKNKTLFSLSQGNLAWVLGAWGLAIIGIFALILAIVEISSTSETNAGILEWAKKFMPNILYNSSKNFMVVIFLPLTIVILPFFAISMFEEAGLNFENWEVLMVWLVMLAYFLITNWISMRFSEISQWFFTVIQMIPLFIVPLLGFMNILPGDQIMNKEIGVAESQVEQIHGLAAMAPSLVMVSGIPAIMFAFDGFYNATSLKEDMVEPKKNIKAIVIGIAIIASIYIWVTIGFGLGTSNGSITGIEINDTLKKIIEIIISVGVISTINGYVMTTLNQFEYLDSKTESMILVKVKKTMYKLGLIDKSDRFYAFSFLALLTPILSIIFWAIGSYAWTADTEFDGTSALIDTLSSYNSLIIYLVIGGSIVGGIINRKTNRIPVQKFKYFLPAAYFAILFIAVALLWAFIEGFVNLSGYNDADVLNNAIKLGSIAFFLSISFILGHIESKWLPKHHAKIGHVKEEWEEKLIKNNKEHMVNKAKRKKRA